MNFKPMLSATLDGVDLEQLRYPLLASPKYDGVRCIVWEGVAYSRNAKPIRNRFVQEWAKEFHNIDGELIVGSPVEDDTGEVLGRTQSGVMSFEGEPDFKFFLFDTPEREWGFRDQMDEAADTHANMPRIVIAPQVPIRNASELLEVEMAWLGGGYEGVMLRDPTAPYKNGRSTLREGYLMKLKRFTDGEAVVVGLEEGHHNTNAAEKDELGRTKRSYDSAGLVGNGMVGTIIAKDPKWGELRIAPGKMSHAERIAQWKSRTIIGMTIHWRCFGYGIKDKPRFPRFYGIREDL